MARTILLADDSSTIRKIVELTFHDTDIRVELVGTGAEALAILESVRPDLVLADVVMPEPTGYEICKRIKASDRPIPVVLLAGTFEPFDGELARECGADDHLVKPFEARDLLDKVEALLRGPMGSPLEVEQAIEDLIESDESAASGPDDGAADEQDPAASEPTAPEPAALSLSPADLDALAQAVVERLSDRVVREIAGEVVPRLAREIIGEQLDKPTRED